MDLNTPILITGAGGFIGKNLVATLKTAGYTDLMLFERDDTPETLAEYAARAGFVFHLAGINRPKDPSEFYAGNAGLTETLLSLLDKAGNKAPVLVTSSTQAALDNDYGKSKAQAEQAIFAHGKATGAPVYVFRLPGVFGKWCRPNYNSVVATFCHNSANGLPLSVRDPEYRLPLVYIDDVVASFVAALDGNCTREGDYCVVPVVHETTLGHLAQTIEGFAKNRETLDVPDQTPGSLEQKLYSTWLSYLPADRFSYPLNMHCDNRGSFTEFLHTPAHGQVSINISKPGIVKGNHWHHSKNEKFLVVKGTGVIRFRALDSTEVIEYHVSGDKLEVVDIPTGYTHNIENVGQDDMVTVMWANEVFDPDHPDTFFLPV
ncbi:polysaccharide biosynthesis C-terminal domain-containing protein [Allofournierella massiliensis]|uniref:NAD-dependent epimerase/dehydratase family protein n=1 Tax=Allofournierella massiliensis TaxID=1650663 RepID=A0ABT7ULW5_9FIRM|nr:NAD-dependent epimerase/dehydratase family protein [Fournierella massiliensis]MDM8199705.1 NAD-dependent epimerase/dehydratase family protein [Fournierella massiliensis]